MKSLYFISVAFMACLFTACSVGNVSRSGGLDNHGYIQFIQGGNTTYKKGVTVYIDDKPAFNASVDKIKKLRVKGNTYVVNTGTHHIKVVYLGQTLYERNIIIATQETKQITLP
ncbi:MAG: hypothetical protein LBG96_09520 [Tannerella sp.]|jgi:hypothetical protein|nr:hypothetical protein [Tannerella sp.]